MKVSKIAIRNLFGIFNHSIELRIDDRITIIHGPNGYGKTVILQMIDGLFNSHFSIFQKIPFRSFRVEFNNGKALQVEQSRAQSADLRRVVIQSPDDPEKHFELTDALNLEKDLAYPINVIDDLIPELTRTGAREWLNMATGQTLSLSDVAAAYPHIIRGNPSMVPPWLADILKSINVRFIRTERLTKLTSSSRIRSERPRSTSAVIQYSQELAETIQGTLARSVEFSSSLDSTFPVRLVERIRKGGKSELTVDGLRQKYRDIEEKRKRLTNAGLLDKDQGEVQVFDGEINDFTRLLLSIYAQDVIEKLESYDALLVKIELLQDVISKRFAHKTFSISKQEGFAIRSRDGKPLPLDALSSGEQHELVLLYELLFKVKQNSLILIDEPELSLHIAWQQKFLEDLLRITDVSNFDALIATHSPDIINERWDLTAKLVGPKEK